jgi:hypothetical protein
MVCPGEALCSPDSLRLPSKQQWSEGTTWQKDGCRGSCVKGGFCSTTCGGAANPPGNCSTGDGVRLSVYPGGVGRLDEWQWEPKRRGKEESLYSPSHHPSPEKPLTLRLESSGWYDSGVCIGQMASMKPSVKVTLLQVPSPDLTFGTYCFFDACTDYLFSSDNVGVAVVPGQDSWSMSGPALNGEYEYRIDVEWEDQSTWLWGSTSCQKGRELSPPEASPAPASQALHPLSCKQACEGRPFTLDFSRFGTPQCACLEAGDGACLLSYDYWREQKDQGQKPYWSVAYDSDVGGVPKSWVRNSSSGAWSVNAVQGARPEDSFFAYTESETTDPQSRGVAHKEYLLFGAMKGASSVDRSPCSQVAPRDWLNGLPLTQMCSFATLIETDQGESKIILRAKAGSDPNGYGTSIYLMPYSSKNFISKIDARVDTTYFTSAKGNSRAGGLDIVGTYNDPASKDANWATHLDVVDVTATSISFLCKTTVRGITEETAVSSFNLLQLSSNAVRDIQCDSALQGDIDTTKGACRYPSAQHSSYVEETCNNSCPYLCTAPGAQPGPSSPSETGGSDSWEIWLRDHWVVAAAGGAAILVTLLMFLLLLK